MYEDKTLICKDCGAEFNLLQTSKNFMHLRVSQMNLSVANLAEMHVKTQWQF